ncbi:nitrilase-related carbon-nitrogen hydrolase [Priestia megaterium]
MRKINDCIKQAASEQADLIVFPELCLTGYFIWDDIDELAESASGESLQLFQQSCRDHSIHAVISFPEVTANGHYHITSALIDDTGTVIGTYQKTHLLTGS